MEQSTRYEGGIDFNSSIDYLAEAIQKSTSEPYRSFSVNELKQALVEALTTDQQTTANKITKELQSRSGSTEAFSNESIGSTGGIRIIQRGKLN